MDHAWRWNGRKIITVTSVAIRYTNLFLDFTGMPPDRRNLRDQRVHSDY
jgi:hypothetical protein